MTKKRDPNHPVMNLGLMKIRLVSASGVLVSAFGRRIFHPCPQDGVFRCAFNKLVNRRLDLRITDLYTATLIITMAVIPAKAGIQKNTGFRVKPGMTNYIRLMSPCIKAVFGKLMEVL